MHELRPMYRVPQRELEVQLGTNSAVFSQTFVSESLRRSRPGTDVLEAARGAVNGLLISLAIWIAVGLALFVLF